MIRLLLDEDMPDLLAEVLRARGQDVLHCRDVGCAGWSDARLFERAVADGRAIVTHNAKDFRPLARQWIDGGRDHHGLLMGDQVSFRELCSVSEHSDDP